MHFSIFPTCVALTLALLSQHSLAAPYDLRSQGSRVSLSKRDTRSILGGICDISKAQLPTGVTTISFFHVKTEDLPLIPSSIAPTPLPSPAPGTSLIHVAIGRGTQNYTCDTTNATATPATIGALATLFNATCVAGMSTPLLHAMPDIALQFPVPTPSPDSPTGLANLAITGHHYFLDLTTAFFDLDTSNGQFGAAAFKKVASSPAPTDALVGQDPAMDHGAVAWLKLDATTAKGGEAGSAAAAVPALKHVYRVNTAGGNPPKTCGGMPATFEVQYSAEYWFYA